METSDQPTSGQTPANRPQNKSKPAEYTYGMLCHLLALSALLGVPMGNILGPLVMWLIKKEEDPFVDKCGKESLNFQITATLAGLGLGVLGAAAMVIAMVPLIGLASFLFLPLIGIALIALIAAVIAFTVIASIKASEGKHYVYPYSLRLIK